jgi:TetR/AcrR family transcriptional repressor of nem operon
LKRVYHYLDEAAAHAQRPEGRKGCLLGTFAQELCEAYPEIRAVCADGFATWAKRFGEELARAKAMYAPKASFDPQSLAEHLIAILEGALILGKARKNPAVVAEHLTHYKAYLKTLFKR